MPALRRGFPNPLLALSLALLTAAAGGYVPAPALEPIIIDGVFSDWDALRASESSTSDLMAANSSRFLYLHFRLSAETILQGTSDAVLLLDTDADAATGRPVFDVGADIEWRFGTRQGTYHLGAQAAGLRPADIGLVTAPTVSGRRFELALELGARRNGVEVFSSPRVRVVLTTVQALLQGSGVSERLVYRLGTRPVPEPDPTALERSAAEHLRVTNYNVERNGLFEPNRQGAYRRIFQAIDPDIVGFQEVAGGASGPAAALLDEWVPLSGGQRWDASAAASDAAVASRYPITATWLITPGVDAYRIDPRPSFPAEIMVIVVSLKCCEDPDGLRKRQIDAILAFWRDAQSPGVVVTLSANTPIVMIGDMNLVGDAAELHALRTGTVFDVATNGASFDPDWGASALTDLRPLHTDLPMAYTWRRDNSSDNFSPGRLDLIFFTDSVLRAQNRFVLHTPSMTRKRRRGYGLRRGDTTRASDHLPLVADFSLR